MNEFCPFNFIDGFWNDLDTFLMIFHPNLSCKWLRSKQTWFCYLQMTKFKKKWQPVSLFENAHYRSPCSSIFRSKALLFFLMLALESSLNRVLKLFIMILTMNWNITKETLTIVTMQSSSFGALQLTICAMCSYEILHH